MYSQQPGMYQQPAPSQAYPADQQQYLQQTSSHNFNNFSFNEPSSVQRHPAYTSPPMHQFAAWSGYGGPGGNPLEEEDPVPPNANS